jgi:SPP1 gp7 family putative phage head morphogenesis protein
MPLPIAKYKMIRRIDRDRDEMERIGKAAALQIGTKARTMAYAAWRTTRDVRAVLAAVHAVLFGSQKLETDGIVSLVQDAMVAAHLQGVRRTAINVKDHVGEKIKLSTAYDGAIDFLQRRLNLSEGELTDLGKTYDGAATRVVEQSATSLETALQRSILESTQAGEGVAGGVAALRRAFESEGFTPGSDHALEAIFRTQTQTAYHAGRWESLQDPALADILWGFEYSAIRDGRTTIHICLPLDGMRRKKDDEVWTRLWPPNHWNCRSTPLELFGENDETPVPPGVIAQDGFGFNAGMVFGGAATAA